VVSVLTKTGSNDLHGSAGTYVDTLRLRGALRQTLRLNPADQTIAEFVKTKSADYTANFPSPIHTDNFSDQVTVSTDWVASPKVYVNVTGGVLKYGARGFGAGTELRHSFSGSNTSTTIFPDIPAALRQLNSYVDKISSSTTVRDDYTRFNLNADATYYAAFKGQHQIKTGFQFERLENDVLTGQTQPTITLNWNASRSTFDGRLVRGTYGYWSTTKNVVTVGDIHANNVGVSRRTPGRSTSG